MINVDSLKQLVDFLANKAQTGASMSPNEFNLAMQSATQDAVRYYYGLAQRYAPGMPMPPVAWEVSQLVSDYLDTIKVRNYPITVIDSLAPLPSDYLHYSTLFSVTYVQGVPATTVNTTSNVDSGCSDDNPTAQGTLSSSQIPTPIEETHPVRLLDDAHFQMYLKSAIRKPTKKYPVARMANGYIEIAPSTIDKVYLTYIRYPRVPIWAYTTPNGYDPVYDPALSQDIELPAIMANELAYYILTKLGINVREPMLSQYAEMMKERGV